MSAAAREIAATIVFLVVGVVASIMMGVLGAALVGVAYLAGVEFGVA